MFVNSSLLHYFIQKFKQTVITHTYDIYIYPAISTFAVQICYTVDSRYLEFDGTMEKIRVNRSSTQEEL